MLDRLLRRPRSLRTFRWITALLAFAAGVGLAVAPATAAHAGPVACSYRYSVQGLWSTGFTAELVVHNDGAPWSGWLLEFDFAAGERISTLWNGNWQQANSHVLVTNATWNGNIYTGGTFSIGFVASHTGVPAMIASLKVNGTPCRPLEPLRIIVVDRMSLSVPENGLAYYTVRLSGPPTSVLMVNIARSGDSDILPSANFLVFTPASWSTPQTVYVAAKDDPDNVNGVAAISHSAVGYTGVTIGATEIDDD